MKSVLMSIFSLMLAVNLTYGYGIVDNSAGRDTLSIPFLVLDSVGSPVDLADGDSLYVLVFYPGGAVAFKDSMAYDDAKIKSYDWEDFGGGKSYAYCEQVSVLDGTGPVKGVYSYILYIDDNTSAELVTTYTGMFQVVTSTLDASLDSAGIAAANAAQALDSLGDIIDSLNAMLDTLQNQDDWVGNVRYSSADSILQLRGLHIRGTTSGDTALIAHGNGSGMGGSFFGGASNGHGLYTRGQGDGFGFLAVGGTGNSNGTYAIGYGTGHGIYSEAVNSGNGLYAIATGSGNGARIASNGSSAAAYIGSMFGNDIYLGGDGRITDGVNDIVMTNDSVDARANVLGIADNAAAADSLKSLVDGSGTFHLKLTRFSISGANGSDGSFYVTNSSGPGVKFGSTYNGAEGYGLYINSGYSDGMLAVGHGSGHAGWAAVNSDAGGLGASFKADGSGGTAVRWHDSDGASNFLNRISDTVNSHLDSVTLDIAANIAFADTVANRVLEDSLSYKGSGGDSTSIARWVWNTPQENHSSNGTFGKYLDSEVSGVGTGSGIYSCGITVIDSSSDQVVPGVKIVIRNVNQSALIALGVTDNYGSISFNLDADTFLVVASAPGYIFGGFDSLVVTEAVTDTVYTVDFDPGSPTDPDLCRVYGFLYDISGQPEPRVEVTAWLPSGATRSGTNIVSPYKVTAVSDSIGYFYLDLIPNSQLNPSTTKYEITITRQDGTILRERVTVPDLSEWMLSW